MDVDLREALRLGFGPEPAHRPVSERVEAGHRAVRRRRLAGSAAAVACAACIGIGISLLTSGGSEPGSQIADTGTTSPTSEPSQQTPTQQTPSQPTPSQQAWGDGELARYDDGGTVEIRPGVTVLDRVDEPYGDPGPHHHSVALSVEFQGAPSWLILEWSNDASGGSASASGAGANPEGSFRAWVEQNVAANDDDSAGYLSFADDGSLVASHGVEILEQRHPVDLKDFTFGDEPSAAALLQGPDGKKWYVLVRDVEGIDVIPTPYKVGGPDLDAFLDWAKQNYASGEGLR